MVASAAATRLADPWAMALIHRIIGSGLEEVTRLVTEVEPGDRSRAGAVAEHIGFTLDGLHNHHTSEDEMLWPLLMERARPSRALVERMEAQHRWWAGPSRGSARCPVPGPLTRPPRARQRSRRRCDSSSRRSRSTSRRRSVTSCRSSPVTSPRRSGIASARLPSTSSGRPSVSPPWARCSRSRLPRRHAKMLADLPAPVRVLWRLLGRRRYDRYVATFRR